MNYSDVKYRLAILLVLIAILVNLGISSPKSTTEMAASIPQIGDLAPPPPLAVVPPPPAPPASEPRAENSLDGNATWYGKVLHGHLTASGERFDMFRFTAAHKTLPFGTLVRVTNKTNGKWVIVKITDRGILAPGRVIDLSYAAAKQIGSIKTGVVPVHIEKVNSKTPKFGQSQPVRQARAESIQK